MSRVCSQLGRQRRHARIDGPAFGVPFVDEVRVPRKRESDWPTARRTAPANRRQGEGKRRRAAPARKMSRRDRSTQLPVPFPWPGTSPSSATTTFFYPSARQHRG